jgi:DnaK suppressor protein
VSKTPAKSAKSRTAKPAKVARKPITPKKAVARKPAAVSKPTARPSPKKAARPAPTAAKRAAAKPSKAGARAAVASKAAKSPKSPAARGAAAKSVKKSTPAVSVSKSSPSAVAKPSAKPSAKSAAKAPVAAAAKAVPAAVQVRQPPARPARPAAARAQPAPAAPAAVTASAAAASRFADRFSPPRPPARGAGLREPEPMRPAVRIDPKLANAWKAKAGKDLTDDELLAMPDSEYMNDKQLEFFRARLQALKDDLLSNAGETTEHLREDTSIVPDPADRATIEEEHALELRTRDRERKLLKKITQSLARLDTGEYGFCDETGEPIGLARLLARPTATLSLEAQQRREMKQKMFGD